MLFTHHNRMTISNLGKLKSNTFIIKVRYIFQVFNYEHVEDYRTTFLIFVRNIVFKNENQIKAN